MDYGRYRVLHLLNAYPLNFRVVPVSIPLNSPDGLVGRLDSEDAYDLFLNGERIVMVGHNQNGSLKGPATSPTVSGRRDVLSRHSQCFVNIMILFPIVYHDIFHRLITVARCMLLL